MVSVLIEHGDPDTAKILGAGLLGSAHGGMASTSTVVNFIFKTCVHGAGGASVVATSLKGLTDEIVQLWCS